MSHKLLPTILLVPGFCSTATSIYAPLITHLQSLGYTSIHPIDLPSIPTTTAKTSLKPNALAADIALIHSILTTLISEEEKEVIIVGHSYGGVPSLYASEGLWKSQRPPGKKGGVLKTYLISAAITLPGQSIASVRAEWADANPGGGINDEGSQLKLDVIDDVSPHPLPPLFSHRRMLIFQETFVMPIGFEQIWFNDFDAVEREKWGKTLRPAAISVLISSASEDVSPHEWDIEYLIATDKDLAMPAAFQKFLVGQAREAGAKVQTTEMVSGHFVQISRAKEVAEWISNVIV